MQSLQTHPQHCFTTVRCRPGSTRQAGCRVVRCQADQDTLTRQGPPPKPFTVAKGQLLNVATAAFPFVMRLGSGGFGQGYSSSLVKEDKTQYAAFRFAGRQIKETSQVGTFNRPAQPLELYDFEGCPFCRKVREAVSILDLTITFYPCPQGGPNYRPKAKQMGGKSQFPYLVDPNTSKSMYESDAIISYLFNTYGDGKVPLGLRLGIGTALSCGLGLIPRVGAGSRYKNAKSPAKPVIYWGYEASPFCKLVKEQLTELEIPHTQVTAVRGSPKRQELYEKVGHFQVPYLEDPNTGVSMFESADIINYLRETYAA